MIIGVISSKKLSEGHLVSYSPKPLEHKSFQQMVAIDRGKMIKGTSCHVALFLLKIAALETVHKFSRARCPFVWSGLQALQVLCCPPFKWLQKWNPFRGLIKSMQTLSSPLLVLSIMTAFSEKSGGGDIISNGIENAHGSSDSDAVPESQSESRSLLSISDSRICDEVQEGQCVSSKNWLLQLYAELENQGINLPERINEDELHRFYSAANHDFSCLLSSVKKSIRWRETYRILEGSELEKWSNMVFWHGFDVNHRPCLIVRLDLACVNLPYDDRPQFAQAVVSQVEHGILHLVDNGNPHITVLVDCDGMTPLRIPIKMMIFCSNLLQDHFPNRLGCLIVIRLPSVVRATAQTFIKVLRPATQKKLKIEGEMYQKLLSEYLQTVPSYLGGVCTCLRCENDRTVGHPSFTEKRNTRPATEGTIDGRDVLPHHPSCQSIMHMDGHSEHVFRAAVVGILILSVFIAFLAGIYDPEIRPVMLP